MTLILKRLVFLNIVLNILLIFSIWAEESLLSPETYEALTQARLWLEDLAYLSFDNQLSLILIAFYGAYIVGLVMVFFEKPIGRHVFLFGAIAQYVVSPLYGYFIYSPLDSLFIGASTVIDGVIIYALYLESKSK